MKKTFKAIFLCMVYYLIPIGFDINALLDVRIILVIITSFIMVLSQPDMKISEEKKYRKNDRLSFYLILITASFGQIISVIDWHNSYTNNFDVFALILGVTIIAIGMRMRIRAIKTLGDFFHTSIRISSNQKIITYGPYSKVRHPSYLGAYFSFIGSSLILNSFYGVVFNAVFMLICYLYRIKMEELMLIKHFGSKYNFYLTKTKKFIPFIY